MIFIDGTEIHAADGSVLGETVPEEVQADLSVVAPKKRAKKPARKAKVAKRAKGKDAKSSTRASAKSKKTSSRSSTKKSTPKKGAGTRRGPKGNPPEKVLRKGDAAYGKKVAAARKAKGLRQWQLAEKMGVGQPSVCNVERGTLAAGIGMQKLFKKHLGVPLTKACEAAIAKGHKSIVKSRKS